MINIVHAADDTQMKNVSVYESEDALKESLTKQYTGSDAFEVQSFEAAPSWYPEDIRVCSEIQFHKHVVLFHHICDSCRP